jgi:hypothetical protein
MLIIHNDLLSGIWGNQKNNTLSDIDANCFPNPIVSEVNISYVLPEKCNVTFTIYNQIGNKINEEFWLDKCAGEQEITIPASEWVNGMYFYSLYAVSSDGNKCYKASGKMIKKE